MGVLFFCASVVHSQSWKSRDWQRILIYRDTLFGYESEADDKNFFLHENGKYSPEQELQALIKALPDENPNQKVNVYCRFPARIRFLKKHMLVPEPKIVCEDYLKFRNRVSAKSISVVFSSYYLNNPASSFGHTFIRLGKMTNEELENDSSKTELLDTGINYGALTQGAGPVVFAIGGLSGWFQGNYNAVPYYYKVREYNDFETRDLWSYQLDFTQEEIDFIVDYIWELGSTKFDYFFLTENCSYHVLSILEAARPSLRLHGRLPSNYTIPSETLKAFEAEGLIRKVTFRPAPSTQFNQQLALLKTNEEQYVKNLVYEGKPVPELAAKRRALIYDTAISLVDYKYAEQVLRGEEKAQNLKRPLLIARSKIPLRSQEIDYSHKLLKAPHMGHGQKRLALGLTRSRAKTFTDLEWRFAFHDFLDIDTGYPPKTKLEVGKFSLRTDGRNIQLREAALVDVMMLGRWDSFEKSPSWKVKLGQWQTRKDGKDLSSQGVSGGYGYSLTFGKVSPYLLGHLETSYVSQNEHKFKLSPGADLGVLTDLNDAWKLHTVFEWRVPGWNESSVRNEIRYSNKYFGIGGAYQAYVKEGGHEISLRLFRYL